MIGVLKATTTTLLALLYCEAVVRCDGDREILVPRPQVVVEDFLRDAALNRTAQARHFLAKPLRSLFSDDQLRELAGLAQTPMPHPYQVLSWETSRSIADSTAYAVIKAPRDFRKIRCELKFIAGRWQITAVQPERT